MKTLQRTAILLTLTYWTADGIAQDYMPLQVGNEWIYELVDHDGVTIATDSMLCQGSYFSGDTLFYEFTSYITFTDGNGEDFAESTLFFNGISDPNTVYVRSFMDEPNFIDLEYFKHVYTSGETYGGEFLTLTALYLGDYTVPYGTFSDCYFLKIMDTDSSGLIVAPEMGLIGTLEEGAPYYGLIRARQVSITETEKSTCDGDSLLISGSYVSVAGVYSDTLTASSGADSIDLVTLTIIPSFELTIDTAICEGTSYFAGGADRTESGTYYDTLQSATGCDSVIITRLTVEICTGTPAEASPNYQDLIYPNPTTGVIHISGEHITTVEVYDLFGGKLLQFTGNATDLRILPDGCYFVKCVFSDGTAEIRKILLNR